VSGNVSQRRQVDMPDTRRAMRRLMGWDRMGRLSNVHEAHIQVRSHIDVE
jgi:hypothetical protein